MQKTIIAEETSSFEDRFYIPPGFYQISAGAAAVATPIQVPGTDPLDRLLSTIKWIFLYLPGTAVLHLIPFGFALGLFYEAPHFEMLLASLGWGMFAVFMVMLGIGRLSDLRYLRVPAGIVAAASLSAVVYAATAASVPGDFFAPLMQI